MNQNDNLKIITCFCGLTAIQRTVVKEGKNQGRKFWKCSKMLDACRFFKWNDELQRSNQEVTPATPDKHSVIPNFRSLLKTTSPPSLFGKQTTAPLVKNAQSNSFSPPKALEKGENACSSYVEDGDEAPLCPKHNTPCVQLITKKEGPNKGRPFWTCPEERSCYFMWVDATPGYNGPKFDGVRTHSSIPPDQLVRFELCSKNYAVISEEGVTEDQKADEFTSKLGDNEECVLVTLPDKNKALCNTINNLLQEANEKLSGIQRNDKQWLFPLAAKEEIRNIIKSIPNTKIYIQSIPDAIRNFISQYKPVNTKDNSQIDWSKLPQSLVTSLRPFQKEGVIFGVIRNGRCLIGDEMGLGKTIQAISIAHYFKDDWPLLVICPATLRYNWSNEIERWLGVYPEEINVITSSHIKPDNRINIISYELATKNADDLEQRKFKCIIADESHYLKNYKTERVKNIRKVLRNATRVILITGTPALSRPIELYPQIDLMMSNQHWLSYDDFSKRYCEAKETSFGIDRRGSCNRTELNYLLSRTIMIRRRKNDVLTDLPQKSRQYIHLCIEEKELKSLKMSASEKQQISKEMKKAASMTEYQQKEYLKNSKWLEMFKKTGTAKLKAVKAYVSDLIDQDVKFLIFAFHLNVLDGIEETVKKHKNVKYIRIDGSTTQGKRQKLVDEFRFNNEYKVAILSITAAGVGLTFTPCSTSIFAELYWTPGTLLQAEDRVHRIGQKSNVTIQYLLAKGTLDDELWPLIQKKIEVLGETLDARNEVNQWDDSEYSKYENIEFDDVINEAEKREYSNSLQDALDDMESFDAVSHNEQPEPEDNIYADENEIILEENEYKFDYDIDNEHNLPELDTNIQKDKKKEIIMSKQSKLSSFIPSTKNTIKKKTSVDLKDFFFQGSKCEDSEIIKKKLNPNRPNYVFKRSFFDTDKTERDTSEVKNISCSQESEDNEGMQRYQFKNLFSYENEEEEEFSEKTVTEDIFMKTSKKNEDNHVKHIHWTPKPQSTLFDYNTLKMNGDAIKESPETGGRKNMSYKLGPATPSLPKLSSPLSNKKPASTSLSQTPEKSPFAQFMYQASASNTPRNKVLSTNLLSRGRALFSSPTSSNDLKRPREEDAPPKMQNAIPSEDELDNKSDQAFEDIDFDAVLESCNLSQISEPESKKTKYNTQTEMTNISKNNARKKLFFGL